MQSPAIRRRRVLSAAVWQQSQQEHDHGEAGVQAGCNFVIPSFQPESQYNHITQIVALYKVGAEQVPALH